MFVKCPCFWLYYPSSVHSRRRKRNENHSSRTVWKYYVLWSSILVSSELYNFEMGYENHSQILTFTLLYLQCEKLFWTNNFFHAYIKKLSEAQQAKCFGCKCTMIFVVYGDFFSHFESSELDVGNSAFKPLLKAYIYTLSSAHVFFLSGKNLHVPNMHEQCQWLPKYEKNISTK